MPPTYPSGAKKVQQNKLLHVTDYYLEVSKISIPLLRLATVSVFSLGFFTTYITKLYAFSCQQTRVVFFQCFVAAINIYNIFKAVFFHYRTGYNRAITTFAIHIVILFWV